MLEVELHRKVSGTLKLQVSAVDWSFFVEPTSEEARMKIIFQNRKANLELSTINRIKAQMKLAMAAVLLFTACFPPSFLW